MWRSDDWRPVFLIMPQVQRRDTLGLMILNPKFPILLRLRESKPFRLDLASCAATPIFHTPHCDRTLVARSPATAPPQSGKKTTPFYCSLSTATSPAAADARVIAESAAAHELLCIPLNTLRKMAAFSACSYGPNRCICATSFGNRRAERRLPLLSCRPFGDPGPRFNPLTLGALRCIR